jgi:antitoxin FitA
MPSITLKGLPPALHRALKARAAEHNRSLNREVVAVLEAAVAPSRRLDVEAMIAEARRVRASLGFTVTAEEATRLKREGRL